MKIREYSKYYTVNNTRDLMICVHDYDTNKNNYTYSVDGIINQILSEEVWLEKLNNAKLSHIIVNCESSI